jgi:DNA-binding PadR family transcriptional regulator
MEKKDILLVALYASNGVPLGPVQVQKLLFLIDREISELIGGPFFNFQPYNYGPFDKAVYEELEQLAVNGKVEITWALKWKTYRLTKSGQEEGKKLFDDLPQKAKKYIKEASDFVRNKSFNELVAAIYKKYPDMRAFSKIREADIE